MTTKIDISAAEEMKCSAHAGMDPRLQLLVARMRSGMTKSASASTAENEVAVIARVTHADAWLSLSEVRDATVIGKMDDNNSIVTGRVPVSRIERVRSQPYVESLKAAQAMRPMLAVATAETDAQPAQMPAGSQVSGGSGVVVGVIDYDGDFVHKNFRKSNGTTRLLALWDQNGGSSPSSPYGYGVEHSPASLDFAINQGDPYSTIGYFPEPGSHGTHVMDIAAGNGNGSGVPGMAPNADLIFVNVTHEKDPNTFQDILNSSFGDSVTLLEALKYIFDKAGTRPAVVNVSLGTNGGPHDGTTLVDQGIDVLVNAAPNRAVVIAASNSFDDGIHATGTLSAGASHDLLWDVASPLSRSIEMDRFKVELFGPNGALLAAAAPGESRQVVIGTTVVALLANRLNDPNNHDNMIGVFLVAGMPEGQYVVRLTGEVVTNGTFHAWIERDNSFQSNFPAPNDNTHTIGSISCGKKVISVGSYDANTASKPLSYFSSAGPTRDGRMKPEISAPGHNVWAAKSRSLTGVKSMSGTSMASPGVAGIVALMFEEAVARGLNLPIDQTIQMLTDTARRSPPGGTTWNDRYGHGRVSAAKAIKAVMDIGAGVAMGTKSKKAAASKTAKVGHDNAATSPRKAAAPGTVKARSRDAAANSSRAETAKTATAGHDGDKKRSTSRRSTS
jgi:hypothetical protein